MSRDLFDDWKFKEDIRMRDDMMRDKIYQPINDSIGPMNNPIDFRPLGRTLDMQDNFRRPLPELRDPVRDIRFNPLRPMNVAPGVDMRPLNDMIMFQKKGVF